MLKCYLGACVFLPTAAATRALENAVACPQELGSGGQALRASMIVTVLAKFLYLFAASMCLGLAFGLGTSFLMKTFRSNSVPQARVLHPISYQSCVMCRVRV